MLKFNKTNQIIKTLSIEMLKKKKKMNFHNNRLLTVVDAYEK